MSTISTFSSKAERELAADIIQEDFGVTTEKVATQLLRSEGLRLQDIVHRVHANTSTFKPSIREIKCSLLKLLQHNCLILTTSHTNKKTGNEPAVIYNLDIREVLYRLHYPIFIEQVKEKFGEEGSIIFETILVSGRVRMDESLETMAINLAELKQQQNMTEDDTDEEISESELERCRKQARGVFIEMAKKRYITRVHPLDTREMQPPNTSPSEQTQAKDNVGEKARSSEAARSKVKEEKKEGITVRGKRKTANESQAIPIELQLMLEAEASQNHSKGEGEAEYEVSTIKKRRLIGGKAKVAKGLSDGIEDRIENALQEQSLVWRFGLDQLLRDLRHDACVKFASENINNVAGVLVKAMLHLSSPHERQKNEEVSSPVSARELYALPMVTAALPKESKDSWRLMLNYITVMCRDKSGMIQSVSGEKFDPTKARAGDGGKYVVHMKKIMEFLKQRTTHSYVQDKYGIASARILRLLIEKRQLEQKTIGELALIPSNDTRRRLYQLLGENLVKMQEIPKRADHNPAFTIFCWSVDVNAMEKIIQARIVASITRIRKRRKYEADENKELIARSDQLVEANDLKKFDILSRTLDRLDRAALQLDNMLMLYQDF